MLVNTNEGNHSDEGFPVSGDQAAVGALMLHPVWKTSERVPAASTMYERHEVILCEADHHITSEQVESQLQGSRCRIFRSEAKDLNIRYEQYAKQLFVAVKSMLTRKTKGHVLIQLVVFTGGDTELFRGLGGILKTARLENPKLIYQIIQLPAGSKMEQVAERLRADSRSLADHEISYVDDVRYTKSLEETGMPERTGEQDIPWKEGGVYLITGGAGGLGLIVAEEIAGQIKDVTLILTGRSELSDAKLFRLNELKEKGAVVDYRQMDIADKEQVKALITGITEGYGRLNGIFHSAGIIRDQYILHKTEEEFAEVLKPKVSGLHYLDTFTSGMNIDFILLFSSGAGETGNPGQADYAAANAFMDAFANYRNRLVGKGERRGKTVSINWPLWRQGGMHVDKEIERRMYERIGMIPLNTNTGIQALYQALAQDHDQVMIMEGDREKLRGEFLNQVSGSIASVATLEDAGESRPRFAASQETLQEKAENYFKKLLSTVIKLPINRIESDAPMENYGIDSLVIMRMTDELEKSFGSLSKTLFFEYQDIRSIAGYFLEFHRDKLMDRLGVAYKIQQPVAAAESTASAAGPLSVQPPTSRSRRKRQRFASANEPEAAAPVREDIAVIGIGGRYPQAGNLDEFWANLCSSKDSITEIPKERWDHRLFGEESKKRKGNTIARWGGFLDDVDRFDPLFFNITPREAEFMDPQERLFLECVLETLEDAGYTREALSKVQGSGLEGNVGVYVGVMYDEYQLFGAQEQAKGRMVALSGITSSIANRVSYFCNFHGPSIGLNTMCSSSLIAIHLACQSIRQGECELAIAGGVNVSLHPNKYLVLDRGNFMSSKGRCESFGNGGDGYVPGEGVGAILLKPLSKAIKDQDQIYGVIKGSSINHGGKTNGYTVPNPNAQASMIRRAMKEANVDARHFSYIEAHGTGTALGDPIEITALTKAFEDHTDDKQFCAIGSVKSNIGHLESAAGIVGVTKVLLQMKYGKLVPSLHSSELNPNIDFEKTPFKVQHELEEWKRPVIERDGVKKEVPRLAGISAFGAGGSNAHLVIEEYMPRHQPGGVPVITIDKPAVILLSGKEEENLKERARQLLREIGKGRYEDQDLPNIAYTLQIGREAMEARLGMTVTSVRELEQKLNGYLAGQDDVEDLYVGRATREKDTLAVFKADNDLQQAIDSWIGKGKYGKLLDFWVKGLDVNWESLYPGTKPKRISLPTYPFAKERYWIPGVNTSADLSGVHVPERTVEAERVAPVIEREERMAVHAGKVQLTPAIMKEKTVQYCKQLLAWVSSIPVDRIESDVSLENYGIDSVMIKQLAEELKNTLGPISMTIFFEYQTIRALADYFTETYSDKLMEMFGFHASNDEAVNETDESQRATAMMPILQESNESDRKWDSDPEQDGGNMDIAIIGLSGRYPQANNIHEFWENLKAGRDCVIEIPEDRWDYKRYYDADKFKVGKINSKWGGFIEDVDKFDPLFFNISPEDAEFMDPQERLFLECVYETIEDAGYTREALSQISSDAVRGNVGVFVGATFMDYQLLGVESQMKGKPVALSGIASSIANRVSYFCNFNGPSMAIDSMCSSSLTALHVACDSIMLGRCRLAVVGGVNLSLHPNKYLFLSRHNFMSSKGKCESFGSGGDGYVPGEGVGAILLKPLKQAVADGDQIYGVVKSTAVNHGGKTNGYSVPNPAAHAQVIHRAFTDAGVNPRMISYIEAHGTGTLLGDPIEIAGLTKAFDAYTIDRDFCSIGSAKSNIGHLEAAAGIAGITKVLLQMKYKQYVPSIHSELLNANIDFQQTPFSVQQRLEEWKQPIIEIDGEQKEYPRIAGISSFGAGGSNSHAIIEEYVPKKKVVEPIAVTGHNPAIIVLSAKKENSLKEQAMRLLDAINAQGLENKHLADIAYTLQVGRESMEERLAVVVTSIEDLSEKLEGYVQGKHDIADLYRSQSNKQRNMLALFNSNEELQDVLHLLVERKKYSALLELWITGIDVDWERLYIHRKPKRISLPTYPFARERYWFSEMQSEPPVNVAADLTSAVYLHPLLHRNTSNLEGQKFSSTWTGNEFFLRDHVILGEKWLPEAAYLEMIRAAILESVPEAAEHTIMLNNIAWSSPAVVNGHQLDLHIGIYPVEDGEVGYEIYSAGRADREEATIHSQGRAVLVPRKEYSQPERVEINKLQAECSRAVLSESECYGKLSGIKSEYGSGLQGIERLYAGDGNVLAKLAMPESVRNESGSYILHPTMLNSAIQAMIGLAIGQGETQSRAMIQPWLPVSLEQLELPGKCTESMWAMVRTSESVHSDPTVRIVDIDLCDETGNIQVRMKKFAFRTLQAGDDKNTRIGSIMLHPVWEKSAVIHAERTPEYVQRKIFLCEADQSLTAEAIESLTQGASSQIFRSEASNLHVRFEHYAVQLFREVKNMLTSKPKGQVLVQFVVFADDDRELFRGLGGLLKTAQLENPKLIVQIIQLSAGCSVEEIAARLEADSCRPKDRDISYVAGTRYTKNFEESGLPDRSEKDELPWKEGGVYLLTGGAGGLGFIFAGEMSRTIKDVNLILTGRSALSETKQAQLNDLKERGANVQYRRVDITDREQVQSLIAGIVEDYGKLNGIIHGAGIIRDQLIIQKSEEEFAEVLGPKVSGLLHLDAFTSGMNLDFMILFSSGTGEFGNPGQADYAAANAFMDAYASYRNTLVATGERQGKTVSINWPLWEQGGMHVDKEIEKIMFDNVGMVPMKTETGIKALYQALDQKQDQVLVMEGDTDKIRVKIRMAESVDHTRQPKKQAKEVNFDELKEKVIDKLTVLFGESIKLRSDQINAQEPFETYGVDSVKLTLLNRKLADHFSDVSNTIFFEYRNFAALSGYLASEFPYECMQWIGDDIPAENASQPEQLIPENPVARSGDVFQALTPKRNKLGAVKRIGESADTGRKDDEPIAVIGVSGRFPMARNIDEFWDNLKVGKNCITALSEERWPLDGFFNPNREDALAKQQSFSKWGGFLEGFADFDPLFFNISPAEAMRMDPQERIFLEQCWKAVEDAGYVPSRIDESLRNQIGVFGGVTKTGFNLWNGTTHQFYNTSFASIVNRLSYVMDFHGPSVPVDTMCSSSLAALHQACEGIRHGEISMAVVGAVNLYVHPSNYTSLAQGGLLSDRSSSTVFGKGGNGFIPSEGVGAVVLKRLSDAERDNDHIWAVIKGSAVSHSGRTNGYNVPDPAKQAAVIQKAMDAAGIDPRTIRHIEAAASGSEMVDAIEMSAITKVFGTSRDRENGLYTLGSIKAGLGHGESVSGMAQFIKALLQLKHKQICPTSLPDQLNPSINFDTLPFTVETKLANWPEMELSGERSPRRIGINSFGAGGVYAHVIVEEYDHSAEEEDRSYAAADGAPKLFVFSAKTNHALRDVVNIWKAYLKEHPGLDLRQLAYVLQLKREPMKRRFAAIAHNAGELIASMEQFLLEEPTQHAGSALLEPNHDERIKRLIAEKDWAALAQFWLNGATIPWEDLYLDYAPKHIPQLPTYPFRPKSFWPNEMDQQFPKQTENHSFISVDDILGIHPEHMATSLVTEPETESGFIPVVSDEDDEALYEAADIERRIKSILVDLLYLDEFDEFDVDGSFMELGLDSILVGKFIHALNSEMDLSLSDTIVFDYSTTSQLAKYMAKHLNSRRLNKNYA
ncbi:SDR family NAD(P)-dependent oxidoreductase [Paenibacillus sp. HJL G12]|uniref:SDR family NAD(P)-dependent oxidoreductase n=1 Tax=Paenibacillus dendrobii TaxID=2691084 RepID=A0A7X3IMT4_9BACL|nr:SDR family NAD(P)-dependent oxidoreductase [Paenibacillus dendrobii]MWV45525.1 SDR family NAD(P)-dependent oxidoreductase [Paenibacillus dendrobii]